MPSFEKLLDPSSVTSIQDWQNYALEMYKKLPNITKEGAGDADDLNRALEDIIQEEIELTGLTTAQLLQFTEILIQMCSLNVFDETGYKLNAWSALLLEPVKKKLEERLDALFSSGQGIRIESSKSPNYEIMQIMYSIEEFAKLHKKAPDKYSAPYKKYVNHYHQDLHPYFVEKLEFFKQKNDCSPVTAIDKKIFDFLNDTGQPHNNLTIQMQQFSQACVQCYQELRLLKGILDNYESHVTTTVTDSSKTEKLNIIKTIRIILDDNDRDPLDKLSNIGNIFEANQVILQQDSLGERLLQCIRNIIAIFAPRLPTPSEFYRSQFAALKDPNYLRSSSHTKTENADPTTDKPKPGTF